jgi:hypothetical protein
MDKITSNQSVVDTMNKFRGERSILELHKVTGISRITLTAWSHGQDPDLGVLLKNFFQAPLEGRQLAYELVKTVWPGVAKMLPYSYCLETKVE